MDRKPLCLYIYHKQSQFQSVYISATDVISQLIIIVTTIIVTTIDLLIVNVCHHPLLYDRGQDIVRTFGQKRFGMSYLDCDGLLVLQCDHAVLYNNNILNTDRFLVPVELKCLVN